MVDSPMNPLRRLIERWRSRGQGGVRRIVLLQIDGLEPASIDRFLAEGLLHNLALMSDLGLRHRSADSAEACCIAIRDAARERGLQIVEQLPPDQTSPADLDAICRADQLQQERLVEGLDRLSTGLVCCTFDMPARLCHLFGPKPDARQQLVLRDVYARMDEIVGKAYSFVDEQAALVVVIAPPVDRQSTNDATAGAYLFCNRGSVTLDDADFNLISKLFPPPDSASQRA